MYVIWECERERTRDMYGILKEPTYASIHRHMEWWCSQQKNAVNHLVILWDIFCARFEEYSAEHRDELVLYMCMSTDTHRELLGLSWVGFYCLLKDPRPSAPSHEHVWQRGKWVYKGLHGMRI